ncbi:MAG: hypothetical protein LAN36_11560 [Acidobacteriia bacterium]|nr:hypothetical protein [Terriglobia bacterium]
MANPTVEAVARQALQYFDTLQAQQQQAFGGQQAALNAVREAWAPVLKSGVIPYGYSAALDSLLQAHVQDTGAQATTNAVNAEALREKQVAGGANVMPSGASAQINAEIQARGQQAIAQGLQEEKLAGYDQGVKNLEGATQAELGIAGEENPTGLAGAAVSSGDLAERAGAEQFKENQQDSMFNKVMGGISTVAGAAKSIGLGFAGGVPALAASGGMSAADQAAGWWNGGNPIS